MVVTDTTCDSWGSFYYIKNVAKHEIWSAGYQPAQKLGKSYSVNFKADKAEKRSRTEYVQQAIKMLLPDDAMILTLFYQGEQSLEEISKVTGYEANSVKVKLHRARLRLKEKLELLLKEEVKDLIH